MMDQKEQEELREGIEDDVANSIECDYGACDVETDSNSYEYKWRDGKAVVEVCDDEAPVVEYIYRVRVELVAVVVGS